METTAVVLRQSKRLAASETTKVVLLAAKRSGAEKRSEAKRKGLLCKPLSMAHACVRQERATREDDEDL